MRRAALAAVLLALAAAPASAQWWRLNPFREPSDRLIRPVQALHDEKKPREVVAALTPQFMQRLRGTDLRQAYVLLGENLDILGRTDEALGVFQLGVKLFPQNVDLLTRQAGLLHRTGLDAQARPLFERALAVEPKHWGAHLGLAEIARSQGFLHRSAEHFEHALEAVGDRAPVWRDYAEVLLSMREYRTADLALRRCVELDPEDALARVLLGQALRQQGDLDGAVARLDEALALGAGLPAKRAKALWLVEAGRGGDAVAAAESVLRESPTDAAGLWARARARLSQGKTAAAIADLRLIESTAPQGGFLARAARALAEAAAP